MNAKKIFNGLMSRWRRLFSCRRFNDSPICVATSVKKVFCCTLNPRLYFRNSRPVFPPGLLHHYFEFHGLFRFRFLLLFQHSYFYQRSLSNLVATAQPIASVRPAAVPALIILPIPGIHHVKAWDINLPQAAVVKLPSKIPAASSVNILSKTLASDTHIKICVAVIGIASEPGSGSPAPTVAVAAAAVWIIAWHFVFSSSVIINHCLPWLLRVKRHIQRKIRSFQE